MEQNNIKSSGMRALTQEELSTVSGGMLAIVPFILAVVIGLIIPSPIGKDSHEK